MAKDTVEETDNASHSDDKSSGPSASPSQSPSPTPSPTPTPKSKGAKNEKGGKKSAKMAAFVRNLQLDVPTKKRNCNCKNSRCLKLYCECFASGQFCDDCNCVACCNNPEHESLHKEAVAITLERNPSAFMPKIAPSPVDGDATTPMTARHNRGCNCKKSGCLKKYCECFQAGILCSSNCKCCHCKNFEGSVELRNVGGASNKNPLGSPVSAKRQKTGPMTPPLPVYGKLAKDQKQRADGTPRRILNGIDNYDTSEGNNTEPRGVGRAPFKGTLTPKVMASVCELLLSAARDIDSENRNENETDSDIKQEEAVLGEFNTCVKQIVNETKKRECVLT